MGAPDLPTKVCVSCGRSFAWRKKWERQWAEVVYCSDRCRARRPREGSAALEARIIDLLGQRGRGATIDASEILLEKKKQEAVRSAARRLAHAGAIDILQGGRVIHPDHARGLICLRLRDRRTRS